VGAQTGRAGRDREHALIGDPCARSSGRYASAMPDPESRFYESQGLQLHYADWGNETAPPLILVHGGRDHCRSWDLIADRLQRHFHVVAPDLRGHGDSDWTKGGSLRPDRICLRPVATGAEHARASHAHRPSMAEWSRSFMRHIPGAGFGPGGSRWRDCLPNTTQRRRMTDREYVGQLDRLDDREPAVIARSTRRRAMMVHNKRPVSRTGAASLRRLR